VRTPTILVVQGEHVEIFQRHLRSGKTEHRVASRARILLLRGEGFGPSEVAECAGCDPATVWRVEQRYRQRGLDALRERMPVS
jgi:DNA-directed RNA polymerase specialized sigma24 family protein